MRQNRINLQPLIISEIKESVYISKIIIYRFQWEEVLSYKNMREKLYSNNYIIALNSKWIKKHYGFHYNK